MDNVTYVPGGSAIVALCRIMKALTMAAHEENLVDSVELGIGVQRIDDLGKSLPLSGIASSGARVGLVDEAEI